MPLSDKAGQESSGEHCTSASISYTDIYIYINNYMHIYVCVCALCIQMPTPCFGMWINPQPGCLGPFPFRPVQRLDAPQKPAVAGNNPAVIPELICLFSACTAQRVTIPKQVFTERTKCTQNHAKNQKRARFPHLFGCLSYGWFSSWRPSKQLQKGPLKGTRVFGTVAI